MFLLHLVLHYNELDSLNYANERSHKTHESFLTLHTFSDSFPANCRRLREHVLFAPIQQKTLFIDYHFNDDGRH